MFRVHQEKLSEAEEESLLQEGYRYGLSLSGRHHDAQDLVQQAAFRLYRCYGQLKNRRLLYTTIRNLFYDQLRKEKVVAFDSLEETGSRGVELPARAPGTDYGDAERLLGQLEPNEREVIFLHYISGYTAREIGKLTGRPRNTVLSLLHRTRKKLEKLADDSQFNPNETERTVP